MAYVAAFGVRGSAVRLYAVRSMSTGSICQVIVIQPARPVLKENRARGKASRDAPYYVILNNPIQEASLKR
jgi:hypothetical protein